MVEQACPLCGSSSNRLLVVTRDTTYDVRGEFRIVACEDCGHMFLNPRPADSSLMLCYPEEYAPYDDQDDAEGLPVKEKSRLQEADAKDEHESRSTSAKSPRSSLLRWVPWIRSFLNWLGQENATWLSPAVEPGVSKMLEVGCAHGGFLMQAKEKGWLVDGVEPSALAAKLARSKGFDVFEGTLAEAQLPSASRDQVAMWMVLEHVPNPREVVEEVARILKPGGYFAFSVPNGTTWERWIWGRHWLGYDASRHLQIFTPRTLRSLLVDAGFEAIEVIHQSNTRYWWGSIASWGQLRFPNQDWPKRWREYFKSEPPRSWHWLLLLPGKVNALLRSSGRITVVARRR